MAGWRGARWAVVVGLALSMLVACSSPGIVTTATPAAVPASASPVAQPPSDAAAASLALAAFERTLGDRASLSYHVSQRGTVTADGVRTGDYAYEADVSGLTFAGTVAGTSAGQEAIQFEFVYTGDRAYVRDASGTWQAGPRDEATANEIVNMWRFLGRPADLVFSGTTTDGARTLYRYAPSEPIPYQSGQMAALGGNGSITALELQLTRDGTPVRMAYRAEVQAPAASAGEEHVVIDSSIEFGRFGDKIDIKAPT